LTTAEFRGELRALTCAACGVVFGVLTSHLTDVAAKEGTIFCLNGHGQKIRVAGSRDAEHESLTLQVALLKESLVQRTLELERWELEAGRLLEENDRFREAKGLPWNYFDRRKS
jgi:hypothetical protein